MSSHRRSTSPDNRSSGPSRRPKELSFYKKTPYSSSDSRAAGAVGSFSSRKDPLERLDDKRRSMAGMERGDDVPGRYGGSKGERKYAQNDRYDDRDRNRDRDRDRDSRGPNRYNQPPGQTGGYNAGEPLRRVTTRDERDDRDRDGGARYSGGGELRRVETRNDPSPAGDPGVKRPPAPPPAGQKTYGPMIEIIANDRLGRKVRVKCLPTDTVGDLKKLIAAQTGTVASKIQLKKWYTTYKDHIELRDYEINDGMSLEMY